MTMTPYIAANVLLQAYNDGRTDGRDFARRWENEPSVMDGMRGLCRNQMQATLAHPVDVRYAEGMLEILEKWVVGQGA